MPDPAAIRDAGPWAISIFVIVSVFLSVLTAIIRGTLVPGYIHKRVDAERVALRAELDQRNAQDRTGFADMAKAIRSLRPQKSKGRDAK